MKKIIIIFIIALSINSCSPEEDVQQDINNTIISIAKDNLYGAGNEGIFESYKVITDSQNWNTLKNQMNYFYNATDTFTQTEIDFSNYIVIAVFDEIRISSGYSIELDVIWNSENIQVHTTKSYSDEYLIHRPTQPFHIIKINITELPILFE